MTSATATDCLICGGSHDEILECFVAGELRRIADDDLAAEVVYVRRELADDPGGREPGLRHRLKVLEDEARRRRRIAAKGGPLYRGRTSIPLDKIAEIKRSVNIGDLIARDLPIAWMRGGRTFFRCDAHGASGDRNPSLVAYEDQGSYWCYGCASGGDVLDWMIVRHNMNFRQAVEALS